MSHLETSFEVVNLNSQGRFESFKLGIDFNHLEKVKCGGY